MFLSKIYEWGLCACIIYQDIHKYLCVYLCTYVPNVSKFVMQVNFRLSWKLDTIWYVPGMLTSLNKPCMIILVVTHFNRMSAEKSIIALTQPGSKDLIINLDWLIAVAYWWQIARVGKRAIMPTCFAYWRMYYLVPTSSNEWSVGLLILIYCEASFG